ncbi:unnamed protein product [Plutella xylostella]|uniref:(diamondback moth) hypothetical protein n=1 Tax=Plutella xylostella TaxID=51655 RepID=A0A8S4G3Q3_PLUXY|nr:unnamed protein product [Plutella xylostella]
MAATDSSTSSVTAGDEHRRTVDDAFLNKMKSLVERLRADNHTLKTSLDVERSGVRALKAQHEAALRNLKTEYRKKEEFLEKQLRMIMLPDKHNDEAPANKLVELKRLSTEIQSLKAANRGLQEKLKVAAAAESARAAELRAQAARHAALELAAHRDARAQCHKLLEEIKSKERQIIHLQREAARPPPRDDQAQRMDLRSSELNKKIRPDQGKEKSNREDLKTDIQHRKETFYRGAPPSECDSAVWSAPPSLSPQPADMWSCTQCRAAEARAGAAAREAARLSDALRDARDQLELMEFRILELEDAQPDKIARDNLTDSDSGCVSPGSRIKDSASPELKRSDSGYKSPPASPAPRRAMHHPAHDEFKEEFAKAQVLADILDRNSDTSDSLRSNPVKEHLEQMILNAGSAEDRSCLEQVLMLLYNYQALSSSVSEEEFQIKPKRLCDLKSKIDSEIPSLKTHKAIATVSPYSQQQKGYKCESLESLSDERKPTNVLQESGIFEDAETESIGTQTDINESFECTGELNTEIQRLNSIREKLERQGRNRTLGSKDEADGLECRCVKLGKKHKQYYERRLKFLEGKISIYEAAQDVKKAKLAERLQHEFVLENRIQELESQLAELQDKYERLEEECCELEEIENDTRLHWQQLEMDYELCTSQLRDLTEQRECSRAHAERVIGELTENEGRLRARERELQLTLSRLERAVPALIAWNVVQVLGASVPTGGKRALMDRIGGTLTEKARSIVPSKRDYECRNVIITDVTDGPSPLEKEHLMLLEEKKKVEVKAEEVKQKLQEKIDVLQDEVESLRRKLATADMVSQRKEAEIEVKLKELEDKMRKLKENEKVPVDPLTIHRLQTLQQNEQELLTRIAELERREAAYLEMLTQADDMWAEMEGGYKKKIEESQQTEKTLMNKVVKLSEEKDEIKSIIEPLKKKIKETESSESALRVALEKAERDATMLKVQNSSLAGMYEKATTEIRKSETELRSLDTRFKTELDQLRKVNKQLIEDLKIHKESSKSMEKGFVGDLDMIRKELSRSYKNSQELETTNSELKEEVESLEKQLSLTQKALSQCKRRCDDKIKTLSHELSIKTEELEELRSETMRQSLQASRIDLKPDRTEYIDEGYTICTAVPKKADYGRMHHSMGYLSSDARCSCPSMRSHLVGQLIEDLFDRIHNTVDDDLTRLCKDIVPSNGKVEVTAETKAKITNYLLMAISKELVRSIGDADAKTDSEDWQRAVSSITFPNYTSEGRGDFASLRLEGNAGVLNGASRLASVSCACAAARLCASVPELADYVKNCQEEVLDHSDVKIMEEQLANAIESIVNCPSCALGTNAIVWSTDV